WGGQGTGEARDRGHSLIERRAGRGAFADHHGGNVQVALREHAQRGERVADRAQVAAGDQEEGTRSSDIQSSTVWVASSGTMTPPTPSISTRSRLAAARRENSTTAPKSTARPSRAAARSGDSGAAKRQGDIRSMVSSVTGRPSAASNSP